MPGRPPGNGLALASLLLGVTALVVGGILTVVVYVFAPRSILGVPNPLGTFLFGLLGVTIALVGLGLGITALVRNRRRRGTSSGLATGGVVTSGIAVLLVGGVLVVVAGVALAATIFGG